mgnify:CR=1 FL=1
MRRSIQESNQRFFAANPHVRAQAAEAKSRRLREGTGGGVLGADDESASAAASQ